MLRLVTLCLNLTIITTSLPAGPVYAREICFHETATVTTCFDDPFSGYWQENGGLPVFGYPLTRATQESNPDLQTMLLTQWTERNRIEVHPGNQPPLNILLGRMGAERLQQIGRDPAQEGREPGHEHLVEDLKRADQREDQDQKSRRRKERQGDMPELRSGVGAFHARGLV